MKLLPSIAFNDFSGSAGNVTARKTGDRTILSTRTKHSKKKTTFQAATRCRFTDTVRGYAKITEEQRQSWISLAKNLGTYQTSTGNTSITGQNLFVAINSYRKMCGKPQTAVAPTELRPSKYIRYDDFWLSPEHIVFTGLGESENPNDVLYIEMYPAQSPAERRCWDKTVLVAICPTTDWGDIDLTSAFLKKFGTPLTIGQNVFIKICWLDSECGYIKYYSLILQTTKETSIERNAPYIPRAKITINDLHQYDKDYQIERFDIELSPSPKLVSNDIIISQGEDYDEYLVHFGFDTNEKMDVIDVGISNQIGRNSTSYQVMFIEFQISTSSYYKRIDIYSRSIVCFHERTELFGTYLLTV